jgi:hypothetical protein
MQGDDRVRYCPECKLNVYNFSALSPREIERLVAQTEGRLCARYYQRCDGTMLAQNCPTGFRAAIWRNSKAATLLLSAMFGAGPALANSTAKQQVPLTQIQPANKHTFTVTDATGAVIPHAQVTLRNETNGQSLSTQTDEQGQLSTVALPQGMYHVSVVVQGFVASQLPGVEIPLTKSINVQLQLGLVGEVICIPAHRNPVQKFVDRVKQFFA